MSMFKSDALEFSFLEEIFTDYLPELASICCIQKNTNSAYSTSVSVPIELRLVPLVYCLSPVRVQERSSCDCVKAVLRLDSDVARGYSARLERVSPLKELMSGSSLHNSYCENECYGLLDISNDEPSDTSTLQYDYEEPGDACEEPGPFSGNSI